VGLERRLRRSDVTEVAVGFYLETLTDRFDLLGATLLDPQGRSVAGVGDWTLLSVLGAAGLGQSLGVSGAAGWLEGHALATELYTLELDLAAPQRGEATRSLLGRRAERRARPRIAPPQRYLLSAAAYRPPAIAPAPLPLPGTTASDLQRIFLTTQPNRTGQA
jgi:hypothetical protein